MVIIENEKRKKTKQKKTKKKKKKNTKKPFYSGINTTLRVVKKDQFCTTYLPVVSTAQIHEHVMSVILSWRSKTALMALLLVLILSLNTANKIAIRITIVLIFKIKEGEWVLWPFQITLQAKDKKNCRQE